MPGPFTHIYVQRRVAEFLSGQAMTPDFVRTGDDPLTAAQQLAPDGQMFDPRRCAAAMNAWPKFAALGAIGPDIFFWEQDYASPLVPCDELMLAFSLLYYLDDQRRLDDPYSGLLNILAEISDTWASILRFIIKLEGIFKKFLAVWDATIGPIMDKVGQVIDDVTGGMLSALGQAFTELATEIMAIAAEEILTKGDIFNWFSLKMRSGLDEKSFVWSDMLHYRRTSRVPQRLLHYARQLSASDNALEKTHGEQLMAFALGWICHVGTDVIAHSFVNEQCGGPFRTHWQRHHLIENHIDAYMYQCTGDGTIEADTFVGKIDTYPSVSQSALYFAVQIPQGIDALPSDLHGVDPRQGDLRKPLPEGSDRASKAERTKLLDADGELPDWLAETIVRVLVEVYADPSEGGLAELQEQPTPHPENLVGQAFQDAIGDGASMLGHWLEVLGVDNAGQAFSDLRKAVAPDTPAGLDVPPGFPLPWELKATYRFLLSWFKRAYVSQFNMDKPQRPEIFTPPASDYNVGPPDFSGVNSSDDPASEACAAVAAILDWVWKTLTNAAQLAEDLAKMAASAATILPRDAIYYGITLPAWSSVENIRMVLAHLGYLMPQSAENWPDGEMKKPSEIDMEVITLGHTVEGAFAAALAGCSDILGNLDNDAALTADTVRNPKSADFPWLPVRDNANSDAGHRRDVVEFRRPWAFPDHTNEKTPATAGNYIETPVTTSGPYPQEALPTVLVSRTGPATNALRLKYEESGCPEETDRINETYVGHAPQTAGAAQRGQLPVDTNPLGDPVVFSAYLIGQIANNTRYQASFNLDADRAYGYLCWDWIRGDGKDKNARGQEYFTPTVWPEGSDFWAVPPAIAVGQQPSPQYAPAMQLHYPGRHCDTSAQLAGNLRWKKNDVRYEPGNIQGPVTLEAVHDVPGAPGSPFGSVAVVATGTIDAGVQTTADGFSVHYAIGGVPLDTPVTVRIAAASLPAFQPANSGWSLGGATSGQVTLSQQAPSADNVDLVLGEVEPPR